MKLGIELLIYSDFIMKFTWLQMNIITRPTIKIVFDCGKVFRQNQWMKQIVISKNEIRISPKTNIR